MRMRPLVVLVAGVMLAVVLAPPAEAQRGSGFGRGKQRPAPQEEPAPGEYALDGPHALEAIDRGEARQALAYYERTAEQDEQQGNHVRAARAWHVASLVALRLGRYQKAIQSASRSIELFKSAAGLMPNDLGAWASAYSQLGAAYRSVGDLPKARQTLEEGLEFSKARLKGRQEGQVEGFLLNGLAMVAYAQRDYQTALARNTQAAQFFEITESRLPRQAPERVRTNMRRWAANSLFGIGRAQLALGHPDEAEAAFDRGIKYARLSGLKEIEIQLLEGQGNLALSRHDWSKALAAYQQGIALARQSNRTSGLTGLHQGQSRALAGLGRTEEALASAREAVRRVEEIRADLGDSELRSGFFEDKQAIY
jgi:tetratricopeptide (TPR) repeat protein